MDKKPNFKIIGGPEGAREDIKEQWHNKCGRNSLNQEQQDMLEGYEVEKTEHQKQFIAWANEITSQTQRQCGLSSYSIPETSFFIIKKDKYDELGVSAKAFAQIQDQRILICEGMEDFMFGSTMVHELLHLKGLLVLQLTETQERDLQTNPYRLGFGVQASARQREEKREHEHFRGVEEAIVSRQEILLSKELLKLPIFQKMRQQYELMSKEEIASLAENQGILPSEAMGLSEDGNLIFSGYIEERNVLEYVVSEIAQEMGMNKEEVHGQFLRCHFTGEMLQLARWMKQVFGEDGFRRLGDMETNDNSAFQTMEALQKMRRKKYLERRD